MTKVFTMLATLLLPCLVLAGCSPASDTTSEAASATAGAAAIDPAQVDQALTAFGGRTDSAR